MPLLWNFLINLLIIAASLSFNKWAVLLHIVGSAIITILVLIDTVYLIVVKFSVLDPDDTIFYFHAVFGTLCIIAISIQAILGVISVVMRYRKNRSVNTLTTKRLHMISGIIIAIVVKIQIYIFISRKKIVLWLFLDIVTAIIYLYIKLTRPHLSAFDKNSTPTLKSVTSLANVPSNYQSILVIYQNLIYDLSSVAFWHPGGSQVL